MTVQTLAIIVLLVSFFVMIFLRFPIAYAVGLSSVLCMLVQGQALTDVCRLMVKGISSFSLMAVPFFITMGVLMGSGGISEKLIALADACVGWMRGGMAMVEFKGDCLLEVNPRVWGSFPMTEAAQSPFTAHYARAAAGERVTYAAQDYRPGVRMRFLLNDTLAALHYLRAGRIGVFLRSIADLFTAKEALRCWGDNRVFWVYLKNSLFARG